MASFSSARTRAYILGVLIYVCFIIVFLQHYGLKTIQVPTQYSQYHDRMDTPSPGHHILLKKYKNNTYSILAKYAKLLPNRKSTYYNLKKALLDNASPENLIFIATVDLAYVDMAINLWETSFAPCNIKNFLFVCSVEEACDILDAIGFPTFLYQNLSVPKTSSNYGSRGFNMKTLVKAIVVLQALKFEFNVLLTDVDIVYMKNPLPYFTCQDCILQAQQDGGHVNSGFYLVKNSPYGISLLEKTVECQKEYPGKTNQQCMKAIINKMKHNVSFKYEFLSHSEFPNGHDYWTKRYPYVPDDKAADSQVVVHNNYIVSYERKVFRFKEFSMWLTDKNGYYSSMTQKYIVYENPYNSENNIEAIELEALKNALAIGHILNRAVILPRFHCKIPKTEISIGECILLRRIDIVTFDKYFSTKYRESTFLKNPKVPDSIKQFKSPIFAIARKNRKDIPTSIPEKQFFWLFPQNKETGATRQEIIDWFKPFHEWPIIHFHSLSNVLKYPLYEKEHEIDTALQNGIETNPAKYY